MVLNDRLPAVWLVLGPCRPTPAAGSLKRENDERQPSGWAAEGSGAGDTAGMLAISTMRGALRGGVRGILRGLVRGLWRKRKRPPVRAGVIVLVR